MPRISNHISKLLAFLGLFSMPTTAFAVGDFEELNITIFAKPLTLGESLMAILFLLLLGLLIWVVFSALRSMIALILSVWSPPLHPIIKRILIVFLGLCSIGILAICLAALISLILLCLLLL